MILYNTITVTVNVFLFFTPGRHVDIDTEIIDVKNVNEIKLKNV